MFGAGGRNAHFSFEGHQGPVVISGSGNVGVGHIEREYALGYFISENGGGGKKFQSDNT